MKILFCGYFYSDEDDVLKGFVSNVLDASIIELFKEHELAIIGLHSPLVKNKDVYKTQRAMSNDVAKFLGKIPKTILVTLANERLLDCGEKGLINTLEQLDQNDLYVFGDGENDIEMLQYANNSYAPENALIEAKNAAHFKCESCNNNGVIKVIQNIIKR